MNLYTDGQPVGADKTGNHGWDEGGNVIHKSGNVLIYAPRDERWAEASKATSN